jgi:C-terminal processing protease CtpA/Prc
MFKQCFFKSQALIAFIGLAVFSQIVAVPYVEADDKHERGRMEDIMDVVAKDIEKHFYDPTLKGVDWKTITERARQRIRQASSLGDMLAAIASVPYQLNDSHTVFIPPGRSAKVDYGFEAEPFAKDILVYKLKKDGDAAKAGLQLGDKIIALDGFAAKRENFFEMTRYFEFLNPSTEMTSGCAQQRAAANDHDTREGRAAWQRLPHGLQPNAADDRRAGTHL